MQPARHTAAGTNAHPIGQAQSRHRVKANTAQYPETPVWNRESRSGFVRGTAPGIPAGESDPGIRTCEPRPDRGSGLRSPDRPELRIQTPEPNLEPRSGIPELRGVFPDFFVSRRNQTGRRADARNC